MARSVPTCPSGRRGFLRGRRGTWRHSSSFYTQLTHTQWQAWHLRGRRGTCVAGVALAWQAWHLETCSCTLRGRPGTLSIHLRFTWQAWHVWQLGWLWWRARFPRARVVAAAFCVAGVALGDIHLRFTWQAWHLVTSTFVSRGRCGTRLTHFAQVWHVWHWQAWHLVTSTFVSRGRRGTRLTHFAWQAWHVWHWASSGGALGSHVPEWSPRLFAWQAWHLETFIFVSHGRRGTW